MHDSKKPLISRRAGLVALAVGAVLTSAVSLPAAEPAIRPFLEKHCFECHDGEVKKGGLDLTALPFDVANPDRFTKWVTIHDRVQSGEMPPKKKARPGTVELEAFIHTLGASLVSAERTRVAHEGRSRGARPCAA